MTPRPPNWMENRTTTWPNIDQYSPVFTTGMPQVDRAETAVKNAIGKLVKMMSDVEIGSSSKPVTMMISAPKYTMDRRPGCLSRRSVMLMRRMRLAVLSLLSRLSTSAEYHHDRPFEASSLAEDSSKSLAMGPQAPQLILLYGHTACHRAAHGTRTVIARLYAIVCRSLTLIDSTERCRRRATKRHFSNTCTSDDGVCG